MPAVRRFSAGVTLETQNMYHTGLSREAFMMASQLLTMGEKDTIHQVTAMLVTSKTVLFPGPNHLLTTDADVPTLDYRSSASKGDN